MHGGATADRALQDECHDRPRILQAMRMMADPGFDDDRDRTAEFW